MDLTSSPQLLLQKVLAMGCGLSCLKASLTVEGRRYKVVRKIGEGGFSTVDLVEDVESGKKFALKRIVCHSTEDQNTALQEVKVTRGLSHRHIVRVVGSCTRGRADIHQNLTSEVLIVFPLYKQSLQDELERRQVSSSPLPSSLLLSLASGICSAVRELHRAEPPLAHRDIKPHNILLERDLTPILMDFGSTAPARVTVASLKEAAFLQDTAAERCSMTYRPPELFHVAKGVPLDERTDIWSLGCLIYALMFYKGPFDSVYEKGDSVALAVQGGAIHFPDTEDPTRRQLQDLVIAMTNLDLNYRIDIDSVIEKLDHLRDNPPEKL